jgi:23S rRNA (cytosine1962-C5)-methyltransferase
MRIFRQLLVIIAGQKFNCMIDYLVTKTQTSSDYELLDSGDGEKLERYGNVLVSRPDPQALWEKKLDEKEWNKAQAVFSRDSKNSGWEFRGKVPERWQIEFCPPAGGLKFWIKPTSFKHTGIFPEQKSNWEWFSELIKKAGRPITVLNLFGYTGGATLAAAQVGAEVCHVDGSKVAITWAKDNAEISGLKDKPIRWILDDAAKFVEREIKRDRKYDGIILDPPAFGHGPKGEMWKIEDDFLPFLKKCFQVLSDNPLFFLINGYASGYSAIAYKNNLEYLVEKFGGNVEMGELTIEEKGTTRLLPAGIFARWFKN